MRKINPSEHRSTILCIVALVILSCQSGCRTFTPPARTRQVTNQNRGLFLVDYEATRRGTYVVSDPDGKIRIAAEPPPDVALDSTTKLVAGLSDALTKAGAVDLNSDVVEKIVTLTERTQSIVIMRDAMFRLAEMHLNGAINADAYAFLYNKALAGALAIAADEKHADMIISNFVRAEYEERRQTRIDTTIIAIDALTRSLKAVQATSGPPTADSKAAEMALQDSLTRLSDQLSADALASSNPVSSLMSDHPTVPLQSVENKWIIRLPLRDEAGTRATNNFDADWEGTKRFRVFIRNVPQNVQTGMSFQLKRDVKWATDLDVGEPFMSGGLVEIRGTRLYLAEQGFDAAQILKEAPEAVILLVEEGLDPQRVP